MKPIEVQAGSEAVSALLQGAQLDTLRVYSLIIQLGFCRTNGVTGVPSEAWVSVSGNLVVEDPLMPADRLDLPGDFFQRRSRALSSAYGLIGARVASACVSRSGALLIELDGKRLCAEGGNDDDLEEVWVVTSDTPNTGASHEWYVSLNDSGTVAVRRPT